METGRDEAQDRSGSADLSSTQAIRLREEVHSIMQMLDMGWITDSQAWQRLKPLFPTPSPPPIQDTRKRENMEQMPDTFNTDTMEKNPAQPVERGTPSTSEDGSRDGREDRTQRDSEWYRDKEAHVPMYYKDAEDLSNAAEQAQHRHRGSQRFHEILASVGAMHDKKQRDYGTGSDPFANVRASTDFGIPGWLGAVVRANDKMRRLMKAGTQVTAGERINMANEGVEDSLLDLAVYAIIALVLFEEENDVS